MISIIAILNRLVLGLDLKRGRESMLQCSGGKELRVK